MDKLKQFKDNQIKCSSINGGALIPRVTNGGEMLGMIYGSDSYLDSDHDGQCGPGETMTIFFDDQRTYRG
jgi:hypothetical protein